MRAPSAGLELDCIARYKSQEGLSASGRRGWYMRAPLFDSTRLLICSNLLRTSPPSGEGPGIPGGPGLPKRRAAVWPAVPSSLLPACSWMWGTNRDKLDKHWHNVGSCCRAQAAQDRGEWLRNHIDPTPRGAGRRRHRPMVAVTCRTPAPPPACHLRRNAGRLKIGYTVCACGTSMCSYFPCVSCSVFGIVDVHRQY